MDVDDRAAPAASDADLAVDGEAVMPAPQEPTSPVWPLAVTGIPSPQKPVDFAGLPVVEILQGWPVLAVPMSLLEKARSDARTLAPTVSSFYLIAAELYVALSLLRPYIYRNGRIIHTVPRCRKSGWSVRFYPYRGAYEHRAELPVFDKLQAALADEIIKSWRPRRRRRGGRSPRYRRRCRRRRDPSVERPRRE